MIAAFFAEDKPKARERKRAEVESWLMPAGKLEADWDKLGQMAATLRQGAHPLRPFHWQIEFPEVFARDNSGFDAIMGNPPFAGKNTMIASNRDGYPDWLKMVHEGAHGSSDLVAHFFRRAFGLLRKEGCFGLIATNTIGQGDTRATGLAAILREGAAIGRAVERLAWPGEATVVVSVVHVMRGQVLSPILSGRQVSRISAYLVEGEMDGSPARLAANARKASQGSIVLGMGFTFDDAAAAKGEAESLDSMRALIAKNPRNVERIFPYIGGEEVNSSPTHAHHRYVIDFEDFPLRRDSSLPSWQNATARERQTWRRNGIVPNDYAEPVAADWADLLAIVEERIKGKRASHSTAPWWLFERRRGGLYARIAMLERVLVNSQISAHHCFATLAVGPVFAHRLNVFAYDKLSAFACLESSLHCVWSRFFGYTLEDRFGYSPSDCFETFPFPSGFETDPRL